MQQALLIRLRPRGPWRYGPEDGGSDRLDSLFRSDRLFSAVTLAMRRLGWLDEWLDATARASRPAVTFSSFFPFQAETLFAIPPSTVWPPPASLITTPSPVFLAKLRWTMARFVPLPVIDSLLTGQNILADQWLPDPESACLLRRDRPSASPFRVVTRSSASVDRIHRLSHQPASLACVEFEPSSGLWTLACFANSEAESVWSDRVQAAFRLLADSGFGGRRSAGWGQAHAPEFQRGLWPAILFPKADRGARSTAASNGNGSSGLYWLLSLYSPASSDRVDWTGGDYWLTLRTGRIESEAASGHQKKSVRMIGEGSVIAADASPTGTALDVAPDGFAHPVFRAGFALALALPVMVPREELPEQVEEPATEEAIETRPCAEPEAGPAHAEPAAESEPASSAAELDQSTPEPATMEEEQPAETVEPEPEAEAQPEPEVQPEAQAEEQPQEPPADAPESSPEHDDEL